MCAPYSIDGHTIVIGASIGIAVIDQRSGGDAADIMRYADMALYRAKNEGRNRACIYDAVMDADLSQRKLVEQDLRETHRERRPQGALPADLQRQRRQDRSASRRWRAGRIRRAA